jgi:hypothetical protein
MSKHIGFRVMAWSPPPCNDPEVENFEIRDAAIECANLLDAKGWTNVRCVQVLSRIKQFEFDESEEFVEIEWQRHFIAGTKALGVTA